MCIHLLCLSLVFARELQQRVDQCFAAGNLQCAGVRLLYDWHDWRFEDAELAQIQHKSPFVAEACYPGYYDDCSPFPTWIRRTVGDGFLSEVTMVIAAEAEKSLVRDSTTGAAAPAQPFDNDLRHVARLPSVRAVSWASDVLTDESVKSLSGMLRLILLRLSMPKLTDRGLKRISGVRSLERLYLLRAKGISDKGLTHLRDLPNLRTLCVSHAPIRGSSLSALAHAESLRTLWLFAVPELEDESCKHIQKMRNLRSLALHHAAVGDQGVQHLATLKELKNLSLMGTGVTDRGLRELEKLPKLQSLNVVSTKVTERGAVEFRQRNPAVHVSW